MNTNNKEAIQILQGLLSNMSEDELGTAIVIKTVISLLQDNEDIEVQEKTNLKQVPCTCHTSMTHVEADLDRAAQSTYGKILKKPSSKVEKLKELQGRFSTNLDYGAQWADLVKILNVLIEDEE